jgi:Zn-dependent protease
LFSLPFFSYFFLLCWVGFEINGWLGLFNLIPLGPFDGAKVMQWNTTVFGVSIALAAGIVFLLPKLV